MFPAAILQPPFFDPEADPALNYGGIGAVIGHEMLHGYDDQGSQFDAEGNNDNWWTEADLKNFKARTGKLVKQFDGYVAIDGLHVNGKLTLGENIADLGGLNMAYDALQRDLSNKRVAEIDGYGQDQRFFLNWATVWRRNYHPGGAEGPPQHRSARPGEVPRDRRAVEHGRLRRGVPVQAGRCDGAQRRQEARDLVTVHGPENKDGPGNRAVLFCAPAAAMTATGLPRCFQTAPGTLESRSGQTRNHP